MKTNKHIISQGIKLNFRRHSLQNVLEEAHGRFSWTIEKNPNGKETAYGYKGYIVRQNGKIAFKCNWLRDFKPAVRHLEQTYYGDADLKEFYDICKTGDIYQMNNSLFSEDTINTLQGVINHKVKTLREIPQRKESKTDRLKRLARAKKLLAKKQLRGLI